MGKTERGAIWLDEKLFSPYDYWQFWRNTDDRDVKRFLNFFTELEIKQIDDIFEKERNINNLKILLANEATKLLHGNNAAKKAERTAKETFTGSGVSLSLPEINLPINEAVKGISLIHILSVNKIISSKSEARRVIANKGIKIDNEVVIDANKILREKDFKEKKLKISFGKKKHYLIKLI